MDIDVKQIATEAVQNAATLVNFDKHAWSAEKINRQVSEDVKRQHNARGRAGTYKVNLANGQLGTELRALTRIQSRAYHTHLRMTAPWGNSDYRVLPNVNLIDYMRQMAAFVDELNDAKATLQHKLPALIQQAIANNSGLCSQADYPAPGALLDRFSITAEYEPVAPAEAFGSLPEGFAEVFETRYAERLRDKLGSAIRRKAEDLRELLQDFKGVLNAKNPKFYQSTLDKISDTAQALEAIDLTDDAGFAKAIRRARAITSHSAKQYANGQSLRIDALTNVDAALAAIGQPTTQTVESDSTPEPTPEPVTPFPEVAEDEPTLGDLFPDFGTAEPEARFQTTVDEPMPTPTPPADEPADDDNGDDGLDPDIAELFNNI